MAGDSCLGFTMNFMLSLSHQYTVTVMFPKKHVGCTVINWKGSIWWGPFSLVSKAMTEGKIGGNYRMGDSGQPRG